jgi:hypothetical protein
LEIFWGTCEKKAMVKSKTSNTPGYLSGEIYALEDKTLYF